VKIGEIDLIPLSDGVCKLPPQFYVGLDFDKHPEMLDAEGKIEIPIGCYLIRTGDRLILLDAGLGPVSVGWAEGGLLPAALADVGVAPVDIDTVVCSHLHIDHVGWLAREGAAYFPNATVRYGEDDWGRFVDDVAETEPTRQIMEALASAGRLEPLSGDMVPIAPGLTARHTPGHTLGHYCMVVASGDERALLLGDAVECPLQLDEPDFYAISDVDPALAGRTREALWRELEGTEAMIGAAHFPGLEFGRVLRGQGKRWTNL
jgi:glyoxylase-like metal-dependent hydrolase (beta-lactamase superfamily II)